MVVGRIGCWSVVVLCSNNCTRICLGGLRIGCLRWVVVLQRWLFEQVWLQCFNLIQNNFVCIMEKWVQIFKCIISHSSAKSLVPPFYPKLRLIFSSFFGKLNLLNSAVYLLTCQYFGRMEKNLFRWKVGLHSADFS